MERFHNASVVEKLVCFFFFKMRTGTCTFENKLVWPELYTRDKSREFLQTMVYRTDQFAVSLFHTKSD